MENENHDFLVKKNLRELKKITATCFVVEHKSIIDTHFIEADLSNHSNDMLSPNIF